MDIDVQAMSAALEPTRKGLEAAGFELAIQAVEGRLQLKVIAGAEACEDCLVPKSLFRQMARDEVLEAGLSAVEMDILYPIDARRV
jgi:hypothetical protein